ncbi:reverse transcriptase domain-containing protein [Tanacetum coccineum]
MQVIIVGVGGATDFPGMVAALTPLSVIGVPVRAFAVDSLDSLLSIVQVPRGVLVVMVGINNATNAGLLAVRMLGVVDTSLQARFFARLSEGIRICFASVEEEFSKLPPYNKYGFMDHPQLQMELQMEDQMDHPYKFPPYPLPPQEGNMNVTNKLNNGNGNGNAGGNNGCTYKGFVACGPRDFDETGGAVVLTRWIEKMESVIYNSGCLANQRVKYAVSLFIAKALTWWNTQVQARGRDC